MESFERPKLERDLERDKQSFIETFSVISIKEMPTIFNELAVQHLLANLESNKLFILGEVHGVKENVDVIYTLFKKFGFRQLALEWKHEMKQAAEKFLESGEIDFDAIQDSPDGRITAGHFALLKKLKSEGMLEGLICFDGGSGGEGWNARDSAMAENILANISDVPTLVVAGNLHAKTESITFEDDSGGIEYIKGQYHNFGIQDFSELSEKGESRGTGFYQDEKGFYILKYPLPIQQQSQIPMKGFKWAQHENAQ